jgi:hypothetical protein
LLVLLASLRLNLNSTTYQQTPFLALLRFPIHVVTLHIYPHQLYA